MDLEAAVEEANARVIGPAPTVRSGLDLLDTHIVHAAILDANLPDGDVTPIAEQLIEREIPFVINTGVAVPLFGASHTCRCSGNLLPPRG